MATRPAAVLMVLVEAETASARKELAGFEKQLGITARRTSKLGAVGGEVGRLIEGAAGAAALAVAGIGTAAITAGARYNVLGQRATTAMRTLLGSTERANAMMADLMEFASQSPFPRQAFIDATQQMLAFGFSTKQVLPTLDAIQNTVAATGGSAADIQGLVYVFNKVQSTGKFTARELNQLGIRGVNAAKMIGDAFGMTEQEVRDAMASGTLDGREALAAMTREMSKQFKGASDGLRETWAGTWDRIQARLRDVGAALVEPFIGFAGGGALVEGFNAIADALSQFIETGEDGSIRLAGALEPLNDAVAGIADRVESLFKKVGSAIEGIDLGKLSEQFAGLGPLVAAAGGAFATMGRSLPVLGQFLPKIHPITGAILALVAASPKLREALGPVFEALMRLAQQLWEALAPVFRVLVSTLEGVVAAVAPAIVKLVDALKPLVVVLGDALGRVAEAVGPAIVELAEAFADLLVSLVPMADPLAEMVPPLADILVAMVPLVTLIAQLTSALAENEVIVQLLVSAYVAWRGQALVMAGAAKLMMAWGRVTAVLAAVRGAIVGLGIASRAAVAATGIGALIIVASMVVMNWDWVKERLAGVWEWIKGAASSVGDALTGAWRWVRDKTVEIFNAILDFFRQWGPYMLAALTGPLGVVTVLVIKNWESIRNRTVQIWQRVRDAVTGAVSGAFRWVRRNVDEATGWLTGRWADVRDSARNVWDAIRRAITSPIGRAGRTLRRMMEGFKKIARGIAAPFRWLGNSINSIFEKIVEAVNKALDAMDAIKDKIPKISLPKVTLGPVGDVVGGIGGLFSGNQRGGAIGRRRGGYINLGKPTGDSVPALLERDEYVLNRNAVKAIGKSTLDQINFGVAPRFQVGGPVGGGPVGLQGGGSLGDIAGLKPGIMSLVRWAGQHFGLLVSSGYRPWSAGSHHQTGNAADLVTPGAPLPNPRGLAAARAIDRHWRSSLEELIYTPLGYGVKGGQQVPPYAEAAHYDHIHAAILGAARAVAQYRLKPLDWSGVPGVLGSIGDAATAPLVKAANRYLKDAFPSFGGGAHGDIGGTLTPAQFLQLARQAIQITGRTDFSPQGLLELAIKESGLNAGAINTWDINARMGIPSQGLMQIIPPNFAKYRDPRLPNNILHPLANIVAAINYMVARYGGQVTHSPYLLGGLVGMQKGGGVPGWSFGEFGGFIQNLRPMLADNIQVNKDTVIGLRNPKRALDAILGLQDKPALWRRAMQQLRNPRVRIPKVESITGLSDLPLPEQRDVDGEAERQGAVDMDFSWIIRPSDEAEEFAGRAGLLTRQYSVAEVQGDATLRSLFERQWSRDEVNRILGEFGPQEMLSLFGRFQGMNERDWIHELLSRLLGARNTYLSQIADHARLSDTFKANMARIRSEVERNRAEWLAEADARIQAARRQFERFREKVQTQIQRMRSELNPKISHAEAMVANAKSRIGWFKNEISERKQELRRLERIKEKNRTGPQRRRIQELKREIKQLEKRQGLIEDPLLKSLQDRRRELVSQHRALLGTLPRRRRRIGELHELDVGSFIEFRDSNLETFRSSIGELRSWKADGREAFGETLASLADELKRGLDTYGGRTKDLEAGLGDVQGVFGAPRHPIHQMPPLGTFDVRSRLTQAQLRLQELAEDVQPPVHPQEPRTPMSISDLLAFSEAVQLGAFRRDAPFANLPTFHTGGIVGGLQSGGTVPSGSQEVLARLLPGEGVIDAGTMRRGLSGAVTVHPQINAEVRVFVGDREITDIARTEVRFEMDRRDRRSMSAYTAGGIH